MKSFLEILDKIVIWIGGTFSAIATVIVFFQVITRYLAPHYLPDWAGEVVVYLISVAVMLGCGPLISSGRHIRADIFVSLIPAPAQRVIEIAVAIAGLGYCVFVAWFGYLVVEFAKLLDIRSDSSIQFPQWIFYIILPLTFGLMALRYLIELIELLSGKSAEPIDPAREALAREGL